MPTEFGVPAVRTKPAAATTWSVARENAMSTVRGMIPGARPQTRANGSSLADLDSMFRDTLFGGGRTQAKLTPKEQVNSNRHWVYACVKKIGETAADLAEKKLCIYTGSGESRKKSEDPNEPFLLLMENPNPYDTRPEFWIRTIQYLELTGNCIWVKARDAYGVAELYTIPTQYVRPVGTKEIPITGYKVTYESGDEITIPVEDVIHLQYPDPTNRFWGRGTLAAAADAMRAVDKIKASQIASLSDEILNTVYFKTEQVVDDATYDMLKAQFLERYGGAAKRGLPLIVGNGLEVGYLHRAAPEMGYIESEKVERDEILAIFGVPGVLLGITENANRSTAKEQKAEFLENTMSPRCSLIAARINKDDEVTPPGFYCEFEGVVPKDEAAELARWGRLTAMAAVPGNEVRTAYGLKPEKWGEVPLKVAEIMLKYGLEDLSLATIQKKVRDNPNGVVPGGPKPGEVDPNDPNADPDAQDDAADDGVGGKKKKPGADDPNADLPAADERTPPAVEVRAPEVPQRRKKVREYLARADRERDALEAILSKRLRRYFSQQESRIIKRLPEIFHNIPADGEASGPVRTGTEIVSKRIWIVEATPNNPPMRLFADGSAQAVAYGGGEVRILGTWVPSGCLHNGGEAVPIQVRALDPEREGELDDWAKAADELYKRTLGDLKNALEQGQSIQYDALSLPGRFDLNSPAAEEWLRQKDRTYWDQTVSRTTKTLLSERLAQVMENGPTLAKLAKAVREVFRGVRSLTPSGKTPDRGRLASAETIARTEVNGAYNGGHQIVRESLGISSKEWFATFDNRTRHAHFVADGQVRNSGVPFEVWGESLMHPGDPKGSKRNIINCRCVAASIQGDDDELVPD